jgi:DNA-binding LacI/PurR family transcriptional regulator
LSAAARITAGGELPTAVVCANDLCALGLLAGFDAVGVGVPQDVSVVGYDDIEYVKYGGINLTTVRQDTARLAKAAMDTVAKRLAGDETEEVKVFAPELVVRGSVANVS